MYKAVINDNYLCHFNQNHSKKNGQFTSGDGDGDGISNDHANQREKKKKGLSKKAKVGIGIAAGVASAAITAGTIAAGVDFFKTGPYTKTYTDPKTGKITHQITIENSSKAKRAGWKFVNTCLNFGIATRNEFKNAIHEGPKRKEGFYLF